MNVSKPPHAIAQGESVNCDCGATPDDPIHYPGCTEPDGDRDDPSDHYDL